jgi:signal transduction histidine kinase/CheY-like chemotaxis protein
MKEETEGMVRRIRSFFVEERPGGGGLAFDLATVLLIVAFVTFADYITGVQLSFSLFYLVPVSLVAWRRGLGFGLACALVCVLLRFVVDKAGGRVYAHHYIAYWNTGVRAGVLLVTAILVSKLRKAIRVAGAARDAALAASRAKSDFLSSVSHEIRTPLGAILAMAEALAETRLDSIQEDYVRLFRQEGQRLLALINDLLDSAKIEAGRFAVELTAFSPSALLEEIGSIAASQSRAKGLDFSLEIAPDLPPRIRGDPLLLRRTILNLISNAVKFTSEGRVDLRAARDPEGPEARLLFAVSDSGIGIPKEAQARLFLPFSQADASIARDYGGTGLGLSLCKRFVESMGGSISVASGAGAGSVFSFTIPLEIPSLEESQEEAEKEEEPRLPQRALKILLVEDYGPNRAIVKTFLKAAPYQFDEAENGAIGLQKIKAFSYDLVLMDVQMPVMDGYEATKAIRALEGRVGPRTPIIALSARAEEEEARKAIACGCDGYLVKPYSKRQLLQAIASALGPGRGALSGADGAYDPDIAALVPAFLENLRALLLLAREELKSDRLDALGGIGHKLKGAGGSFGFDRVSELGAELESASARGDRAGVERILAELAGF